MYIPTLSEIKITEEEDALMAVLAIFAVGNDLIFFDL